MLNAPSHPSPVTCREGKVATHSLDAGIAVNHLNCRLKPACLGVDFGFNHAVSQVTFTRVTQARGSLRKIFLSHICNNRCCSIGRFGTRMPLNLCVKQRLALTTGGGVTCSPHRASHRALVKHDLLIMSQVSKNVASGRL